MGRSAITCCKDCCKRFPGCHSSCEEYKTQKEEYEEHKSEYMKKSDVRVRIVQQKIDSMHKITKHRNYRRKYR